MKCVPYSRPWAVFYSFDDLEWHDIVKSWDSGDLWKSWDSEDPDLWLQNRCFTEPDPKIWNIPDLTTHMI